MKFKKPSAEKLMGHSEVVDFYDSLPAEFEILGPGEVAVKWPEELTRERLLFLADQINAENVNAWESWPRQESALRALAAIAPERKKRMVDLWEHADGTRQWTGHGEFVRDLNWRKVAGPIEIDY